MESSFEKPSSIEEKSKESQKREAAEKIEAEKELPRPWEEMEKEEEEKLIEKYTPKVELSKESQRFISDYLKEEVEKRKIEFTKEWAWKHKGELAAEGIFLEKLSEERKVAIAIEKGALNELKRKEEYRKEFEEIENLNALRFDLGKKYLPLESQFLLLNFLEKKGERTKEEIEKMIKKEKESVSIEEKLVLIEEIKAKKKELDRLFEVNKELAEKISGRNLEAETKKEIDTKIEPKEKYIENRLEEAKTNQENELKLKLFENKWKKLSDKEKETFKDPIDFADTQIMIISQKLSARGIKIDPGGCLALLARGYNPEEFRLKGILRKKIEVREGEGYSKKEFLVVLKKQKQEFDTKIEEGAKEKLADQWEKEYQKLLREGMDKKIKELAESPEKAINRMYQKVKDRLIAEFTEKNLKEEKKTKEKLEKIKEEFDKKGVNLREFISGVLSRKGELGELKGDLEEDEENIISFLEGYGVKIGEGGLKEKIGLEKYERIANEYKEKVRKKIGFLEFLLMLIFLLLEAPAKEITKKAEKKK